MNVYLFLLYIAPSPVRGLKATDIGATSIRLIWDKPEYENGIVRYRIFQIETDSDNTEPKRIVNELDQTGFFIESGIKPFTEYNFSVQAYTLQGGFSELETVTVRSYSPSKGIFNPLLLIWFKIQNNITFIESLLQKMLSLHKRCSCSTNHQSKSARVMSFNCSI